MVEMKKMKKRREDEEARDYIEGQPEAGSPTISHLISHRYPMRIVPGIIRNSIMIQRIWCVIPVIYVIHILNQFETHRLPRWRTTHMQTRLFLLSPPIDFITFTLLDFLTFPLVWSFFVSIYITLGLCWPWTTLSQFPCGNHHINVKPQLGLRNDYGHSPTTLPELVHAYSRYALYEPEWEVKSRPLYHTTYTTYNHHWWTEMIQVYTRQWE